MAFCVSYRLRLYAAILHVMGEWKGDRVARIGKLKAVEVAKAKGPKVLHDGGGLYLRVALNPRDADGNEKPGSKAWVFRFQLDGKRRDMGLGPYPDISLAEARQRATDCRKQRRDHRPAPRKAHTAASAAACRGQRSDVLGVAEEFIARKEAGWRNPKHRQQWRSTLATYACPIIGDFSVAAVDTGLVVQVLDPIWAMKPETASRVRGRIEAVLDAATVRGYREGPNPAQWKGGLAHLLPARAKVRKVAHHAALAFDEMPAFLMALQRHESMAARALEFAILTAARTDEVLGATWGEIDLDTKVWTIQFG